MGAAIKCNSCGQRVNITPRMGPRIVCPMCKAENWIDRGDDGPAPVSTPSESSWEPAESGIASAPPSAPGNDFKSPHAVDWGRSDEHREPAGETGALLLMAGCALALLMALGVLAIGAYLLLGR